MRDFLAVLGGRQVGGAFENFGEIRKVVKTARVAHIGNAFGGVGEHVFGQFYALDVDKINGRNAGFIFKRAKKMGLAHARFFAELFDR